MDPVACLCTNARRAALALTAIYDGALAPHGLKVTQFSLLRAVARHGKPNLTALSEATGLDRSTLGRNLRVLAGMGLVRIGPGRDQRDRRVSLTPRGAARVRGASRAWSRLQDSLGASLGEDADRLLAVCHRVASLPWPPTGEARR